jgi:predicted Fe-Mo cluster-binding NifX family protein
VQIERHGKLRQQRRKKGDGKMRVAVTSQGENLHAEVDSRFGRTSQFLLVDTETMAFEVIENTQVLDLSQGPGIQAAQKIVPCSPDAVLTGNCGPKAFKVLETTGTEVVVGVKGKVLDVIKDYVEGKYQPVKEANVEGHWV